MKLLIDGDVVRYRCCFAAQKTRYVVNLQEIESGKQLSVAQFDNAKEANAHIKLYEADAASDGCKLVRFLSSC